MADYYDPRLRDVDIYNKFCSEGISPGGIVDAFIETLRAFFMDPEHFIQEELRNAPTPLTWHEEVSATHVSIRVFEHVNPENLGKTPLIMVQPPNVNFQAMNLTISDDVNADSRELPEKMCDLCHGNVTIWTVCERPEEVRNLSWELAMLFSAYKLKLCQAYGFSRLRLMAMDKPKPIAEKRDLFAVPLVLEVVWQLSQAVIEEEPLLREFLVESETDGD